MLKHFYTRIKGLLAQKTVWLNFLGSKVYSRSPSHCLSYDHLPDRSSAPSPAVKQVPAGCHQQWVSCRWAHMHWSSKSIQRPGCERPVDFPCCNLDSYSQAWVNSIQSSAKGLARSEETDLACEAADQSSRRTRAVAHLPPKCHIISQPLKRLFLFRQINFNWVSVLFITW